MHGAKWRQAARALQSCMAVPGREDRAMITFSKAIFRILPSARFYPETSSQALIFNRWKTWKPAGEPNSNPLEFEAMIYPVIPLAPQLQAVHKLVREVQAEAGEIARLRKAGQKSDAPLERIQHPLESFVAALLQKQ